MWHWNMQSSSVETLKFCASCKYMNTFAEKRSNTWFVSVSQIICYQIKQWPCVLGVGLPNEGAWDSKKH